MIYQCDGDHEWVQCVGGSVALVRVTSLQTLSPADSYSSGPVDWPKIPPMTEIPTPFVDTEAPQPDSEELAALYDAKAFEMENQAADAKSPAQAEARRIGAAWFRRKAAEIRGRLA
jgi:hypothetical protein